MVSPTVIDDLVSGVEVFPAFILVKPTDDIIDGLGNVVVIWLEVRVVIEGASLVKERSVDEMPPLLVGASLVFDVVSKSGAFDEWVLVFLDGEFCV